ncbi:MAG TPA: LysR family transcriptional regulator, partial [Bryobacteraceae bacterium]|nr:LysR family transcriptional regulator [Bryobacteraceae bacterium]
MTVAGEKSFSRAAEKLLRTQPAVSLAIQRLETQLDDRLIDRQGRQVLLLDNDDTVSIGSRGVCYAKRALEVLDR